MARFNSGWIKIHRRVVEEDIGQKGNFTLGLFVRLLRMANWKAGSTVVGGQRVQLKPGQLATGLRELSPSKKDDPHLHRVRNALAYLEERGTIAQAASNQGRIITICNWDEYQAVFSDAASETASEAQADRKPGASEAQHSKEGKKERSNTSRSRFEYSEAFEDAYKGYPRKEGKSGGFRIYLSLSQEERSLVPKAIANYARAKAGKDAEYLKHFDTFMGEWRDWLDDKAGSVSPVTAPVRFRTLEEVLNDK